MNFNDFYLNKNSDNKSNTLVIFSGPFSQGIIVELGTTLKQYLSSKTGKKRNNYSIFSIFIEQAQNLNEYLQSKQNNFSIYKKIFSSGIIIVTELDDQYTIISGNLIEKQDIFLLKSKLDKLNSLNQLEIKKLYKEILKDTSSKRGLGLIEIAKKSSSNLTYSFTDVSDELSFFSLEVKI